MIPVCQPDISDAELTNVNECIKSGWIAGGSYVEEFERSWASYCNRKHGIAVNNGTSALIAAVHSLQLPHDSEIIIPGFTIISCALAAIYNNCKPIFVDVTKDTWNIDPYLIVKSITSRTKAIMPVHMYGHPADMGHIISIANDFNLKIIEDAAQAHGADYNHLGRINKAGESGHLSCFSFYSNKLITTGEGGMILTNDDSLASRLRSYRNLCFGHGNRRFNHTDNGQNFRLTNIQAAIGAAQITKLSNNLDRKRKIATSYKTKLRNLPVTFQGTRNGYNSSNWMFGITIEPEANELINYLKDRNIETRPFFSDLNNHYYGVQLPVSSHLEKHGLYLPSSVSLTEEQIEYICDEIVNYFRLI